MSTRKMYMLAAVVLALGAAYWYVNRAAADAALPSSGGPTA